MATVKDYIDCCLAESYVLEQQVLEDLMDEYHQDHPHQPGDECDEYE